jgi:hypothetical protein
VALGPGLGVFLLVLVLAAAVLVVATLDALYTVLCTIGAPRWRRAPRRAAPCARCWPRARRSLGGHRLPAATARPRRRGGWPVALPEPGSGRAWTAVEQDGRRVAAIVHDAALDTTPSSFTRRRQPVAGDRQRA